MKNRLQAGGKSEMSTAEGGREAREGNKRRESGQMEEGKGSERRGEKKGARRRFCRAGAGKQGKSKQAAANVAGPERRLLAFSVLGAVDGLDGDGLAENVTVLRHVVEDEQTRAGGDLGLGQGTATDVEMTTRSDGARWASARVSGEELGGREMDARSWGRACEPPAVLSQLHQRRVSRTRSR